jgi:hypothetical protein
MKITSIFTLFSVPIFAILTSISLDALSVIPCTIQFPEKISKVPTIRIYCGGKIIPSTIDQTSKTLTFSVPQYTHQEQFKLLVTETIDFSFYLSKYQPKDNNTAAYVKLKDGQPYYLFTFTSLPDLEGNDTSSYKWHIDKVTNQDKNNKIPDDAIILCMPPDWIHSMSNTNSFELPTIAIKSAILASHQSEKEFFERAVKLQLAAIDSDTMHGCSADVIKQQQNRIMIAAPTA